MSGSVVQVGGVIISSDSAGGLFDGTGDIKDTIIDEMEEPLLEHRLLAFNCVPVFVKPEVLEAHHRFCKLSLYPVLHSVVDVYGPIPTQNWNRDEQQNNWEMYIRTNKLFAQKVYQTYQPGDTIWVSPPWPVTAALSTSYQQQADGRVCEIAGSN